MTTNTQKSKTKYNGGRDAHDPELRAVIEYVLQKEPLISALDIIKFLSETPLEELSNFGMPEKARKNRLCKELLSFI